MPDSMHASGIEIEKQPPESEVFDLMRGSSRWEVRVHEHGLIALLDVVPRFAPVGKTADFVVVQRERERLFGATR